MVSRMEAIVVDVWPFRARWERFGEILLAALTKLVAYSHCKGKVIHCLIIPAGLLLLKIPCNAV